MLTNLELLFKCLECLKVNITIEYRRKIIGPGPVPWYILPNCLSVSLIGFVSTELEL